VCDVSGVTWATVPSLWRLLLHSRSGVIPGHWPRRRFCPYRLRSKGARASHLCISQEFARFNRSRTEPPSAVIRAQALPPQTCRQRACRARASCAASRTTCLQSRALPVPAAQSNVRLGSAWWSVCATTSRRSCFVVDPAADTETIATAIKPEARTAIDTRRTAICRSIGGLDARQRLRGHPATLAHTRALVSDAAPRP
jgi:hypothetical protein